MIGRRLGLAGPHHRQLAPEPARGGQQEVPRAGGRVADPDRQDRPLLVLGRRRRRQPFGQHRLQGRLDQLGHQLLGRVVAAGALALVALDEAEGLGGRVRLGVQLEQALVDRAQLLDVEGRVGHPAAALALLRLRLLLEGRELEDRLEQRVVPELRRLQVRAGVEAEQLAVEHAQAQGQRPVGLAEQREGGDQPAPQIAVAVVAAPPLGPVAQAADAVPGRVELLLGGEALILELHQPPLLGHHQEQQPVDQPQELPVEPGLGQRLGLQRLPQGVVGRVRDEALAQQLQRALDADPQLLADPAALLDPLLVPALQQAGVRVAGLLREARAVEQAPEHGELGIEPAGDNAFQVDLEIGRPGDPGGVAQQAQAAAVGDDAPKRVAAVQVLLDQGVRRPAVGPARVQLAVEGDDVDRDRPGGVASQVRDREALAADGESGALELQVGEVERVLQQRQRPGRAGDGGRGIVGGGAPALELGPQSLRQREGILDLVGEAGAGGEAEILRALAVDLVRAQLQVLGEVRREQPALDGDRGQRHGRPPRTAGTSTARPIRSGV